jgi:hypothetical protein
MLNVPVNCTQMWSFELLMSYNGCDASKAVVECFG